MNSTTLCIGDPHSIADDPDQERFSILGEFIADNQPDCIVQIGDFITYDSISSHNTRKRLTMEGQRLKKEMDSAREAYNRIMNPIRDLNSRNRRFKKALYKPTMFWVLGNHENRAVAYTEENPEMKGIVYFKYYFNPQDDGWVIVPYKEHCEYRGVLYTHAPMSGMNKPMSSRHLIKNVTKEYDCPIVFGHTHKLGFESDGVRTIDGSKRTTALNIGCYFSHMPEYEEGGSAHRDWWSGLVMLNHYNDQGDYDLATISMERLRNEYA